MQPKHSKVRRLKDGYFKRRLLRWLDKRVPASAEHHLNLNSIFILPTGFGWSFIILSMCLFLLGTNYQNNLMLLLSYLCLSIMLLTLFYTHKNFARLALKAVPITPFHCNEIGELQIHVIPHRKMLSKRCNGDLIFSWLSDATPLNRVANITAPMTTQSPPTKASYTVALHIDAIDSKREIQTCSVPLHISHRGCFALGRLTIACDFPLGLYKCWTHLDFGQQVTVYAKPKEGAISIEKVASKEDANSESDVLEQSGNEDFYALSDYELGQPLNRVSWKHVAKNGSWVSKSFTSQRNDNYVLSSLDATNIESAISALTHEVLRWTEADRTFGLRYKSIDISPSKGIEHMHNCLRALAYLDSTSKDTHSRRNMRAVK